MEDGRVVAHRRLAHLQLALQIRRHQRIPLHTEIRQENRSEAGGKEINYGRMRDKTHAAVPGDNDGGLGFGWVHGCVEKVVEFGLLRKRDEWRR